MNKNQTYFELENSILSCCFVGHSWYATIKGHFKAFTCYFCYFLLLVQCCKTFICQWSLVLAISYNKVAKLSSSLNKWLSQDHTLGRQALCSRIPTYHHHLRWTFLSSSAICLTKTSSWICFLLYQEYESAVCYFMALVLDTESVNLHLISCEIIGLNPFSIELEMLH